MLVGIIHIVGENQQKKLNTIPRLLGMTIGLFYGLNPGIVLSTMVSSTIFPDDDKKSIDAFLSILIAFLTSFTVINLCINGSQHWLQELDKNTEEDKFSKRPRLQALKKQLLNDQGFKIGFLNFLIKFAGGFGEASIAFRTYKKVLHYPIVAPIIASIASPFAFMGFPMVEGSCVSNTLAYKNFHYLNNAEISHEASPQKSHRFFLAFTNYPEAIAESIDIHPKLQYKIIANITAYASVIGICGLVYLDLSEEITDLHASKNLTTILSTALSFLYFFADMPLHGHATKHFIYNIPLSSEECGTSFTTRLNAMKRYPITTLIAGITSFIMGSIPFFVAMRAYAFITTGRHTQLSINETPIYVPIIGILLSMARIVSVFSTEGMEFILSVRQQVRETKHYPALESSLSLLQFLLTSGTFVGLRAVNNFAFSPQTLINDYLIVTLLNLMLLFMRHEVLNKIDGYYRDWKSPKHLLGWMFANICTPSIISFALYFSFYRYVLPDENTEHRQDQHIACIIGAATFGISAALSKLIFSKKRLFYNKYDIATTGTTAFFSVRGGLGFGSEGQPIRDMKQQQGYGTTA